MRNLNIRTRTLTLLPNQPTVSGGSRCADILLASVVKRLLRAPMSCFDTTPIGRTINIFTHDTEVLDVELSVAMTGFFVSFSWLVTSLIVMVGTNNVNLLRFHSYDFILLIQIIIIPWLALPLLPAALIYFILQRYYRYGFYCHKCTLSDIARHTGPDLQRLDAISRSPIQASLAEGLAGASTFSAFGKTTHFVDQFQTLIDQNSSAMLNFIAIQRWLGIRLEFLGTTILLIVAVLIVVANNLLNLTPGEVGLLILWTIVLNSALGFFFLRFTESEARMTSIERLLATEKLPIEAAWETKMESKPLATWPNSGHVVFDRVSARYRPGLPRALENISFQVQPKTRFGIVGRTGSG